MNKEPKLFNVMIWYRNDDGTFRLVWHVVAGFDSKDAEKRFLEENAVFVKDGQMFINTDEFVISQGNRATLMNITGWTQSNFVPVLAMRDTITSWTHSLCDYETGDFYPAAYRQIEKENTKI